MDKKLVRSTSDKFLAGVCGGLAKYFGIDATLVRIGAVLIALLIQPIGWMLYPALWLLMPTDNGGPSGLAQLTDWVKQSNRR
ncbi:PspC domain-containing protein [Propioniciclava tarda]|uniref:PspC domain-containing protein n=2 Tax=Propioniciclava tarda TaxID=433330 RepID=A0A4Q9KMV8_PROTD|nr:PspC domain-containing protein [Propioniciclava tarda]SMO45185.1 phage shock protein C (PspC) family protein [Propioniciclava tarda]HOA89302.1 PspC domain-containing protein [Propioniciclava tarda]HQD61214.1 PspC domain-containing protein [Propioniciclava tarda]